MLELPRKQADVVPGYPRVYTVLSATLKQTHPRNTVLYALYNREQDQNIWKAQTSSSKFPVVTLCLFSLSAVQYAAIVGRSRWTCSGCKCSKLKAVITIKPNSGLKQDMTMSS